MITRRAAYAVARSLTVEAADTPPPPAGHVRIDVAYTGICGTDLHVYHGDMDERVHPPAVIGHEMSGRIAQAGAEPCCRVRRHSWSAAARSGC